MQLRYVFSELGQGLRRNLSMHIAVVLTLFVSMTLVGLGVLMNQQADIADPLPRQPAPGHRLPVPRRRRQRACTGEVTDEQKQRDRGGDREQPRGRVLPLRVQGRGLRQGQGALRRRPVRRPQPGAHRGRHAESVLDHAQGPREFEGITSAVIGLDGVSQIRDLREIARNRSTSWLDALQVRLAGGSRRSCVVAALLLVANTIRLAAFARRKEIAIMRLVGASTLYIALPFLLEALVTAAIGVALAGGALGAFMCFGVHAADRGLGRRSCRGSGCRSTYARADRDRDPRAAADPASDTPADPQIPQSLTPGGYGRGVHFPDVEGRPGALFPSAARRRWAAAAAAGALAIGVVTAPMANAGDLHDKQKHVHKQIEHARTRAGRVEQAITARRPRVWRRPQADLDAVRPRSEAGARPSLAAARVRDQRDAGQARGRRGPAGPGQGRRGRRPGRAWTRSARSWSTRSTRSTSRASPQLMASSGFLQAQTPTDLIRQMEYAERSSSNETGAYDDLHAAEILLAGPRAAGRGGRGRGRRAAPTKPPRTSSRCRR